MGSRIYTFTQIYHKHNTTRNLAHFKFVSMLPAFTHGTMITVEISASELGTMLFRSGALGIAVLHVWEDLLLCYLQLSSTPDLEPFRLA